MRSGNVKPVLRIEVDEARLGILFTQYSAVRQVARPKVHVWNGRRQRLHGELFVGMMAPGEINPRFHGGDTLVQWSDGKWTIERGDDEGEGGGL